MPSAFHRLLVLLYWVSFIVNVTVNCLVVSRTPHLPALSHPPSSSPSSPSSVIHHHRLSRRYRILNCTPEQQITIRHVQTRIAHLASLAARSVNPGSLNEFVLSRVGFLFGSSSNDVFEIVRARYERIAHESHLPQASRARIFCQAPNDRRCAETFNGRLPSYTEVPEQRGWAAAIVLVCMELNSVLLCSPSLSQSSFSAHET